MMMSYQELYPLGNIVIKAQLSEQLGSYCRAFLFLQLAAAAAVFFFAGVNADVMGKCSGFKNEQAPAVQILRFADELCIAVYLAEMLYSLGISAVQLYHCQV